MKTVNGKINGNKIPIDVVENLSTIRCNRKKHLISVKIAEINGVRIPLHYCEECKRHFIGKYTFDLYAKS